MGHIFVSWHLYGDTVYIEAVNLSKYQSIHIHWKFSFVSEWDLEARKFLESLEPTYLDKEDFYVEYDDFI